MPTIKRNVFALCAFILGGVFLAFGSLANLDLFDSVMTPIHKVHSMGHAWDAVGVLFLMTLIITGKGLDLAVSHLRDKREALIEQERQRCIRTTVRTIEDSVLNTYNGCQLLLLEAEEKGLPDELLRLIEDNMQASVKRIRTLVSDTCTQGHESSYGYEYIIRDN